MNKLECHKLCKSFEIGDENINVLNNIDLVIEANDSIAITGKSGAGKSTLLHILATLDRPTSGSVLLDGDNLTNSSNENLSKVRLNNFGFVYQFHYLLENLTIYENCLAANFGKDSPEISKSLKNLNILNLKHKYPSEISGGEQQRAAIARAISSSPKILLLDEPTGNLDKENSKNVQDFILEYAKNNDCLVLYATHDISFAERAGTILKIINFHLGE